MVWYRCPKCTKLFEGGPYKSQTCPACGYAGQSRPDDVDASLALPDGVVGKPRRFAPVLLLSLVTLGLYLFYFYFKAFREADKQHGRPHPTELFFIGLIPVVGLFFQVAYIGIELHRVRGYRRAHGLRSGFAPSAWFILFLLGFALVGGGLGAFLYYNQPPTTAGWVIAVASALYSAAFFGVLVATFGVTRTLLTMWVAIYAEKGETVPDSLRHLDLSREYAAT